jgi:hypothetical protein
VDWGEGEVIFPVELGIDLTGKSLQEEEGTGLGLRVLQDVPRGTQKVRLVEGRPQDPPGIRFSISGDQEFVNDWEIAKEGRATVRDVGSYEVEVVPISSESLLALHKVAKPRAGYRVILHARADSKPFEIPLPEGLGKGFEIADGVVAKVERFFLNARLVKGVLEDVPTAGTNPAVIVEVRTASGSERHTLFTQFPDFNITHNGDPNQKRVERMSFVGAASVPKPRISILVGPGEQLHLQLTTERGIEPAVPIAVKESMSLQSSEVKFELTELLLHARSELHVRPVPQGWQGGESSYLQVELSSQGISESFWMRYGSFETRELAGREVSIVFGQEIRTLPFSIALKEFEVVTHPGSSRPSEYRSQITITPASKSLPPREEVISMNRPLDEQGFRLFQSSYKLGTGNEPDATILSISHDPGVPIVYISFGMLVLGIAWYLRNQSRQAMLLSRAADRARAQLALAESDER